MMTELEKYIKVWGHKEYRTHSPGQREALLASQLLTIPDHSKINIYGCGTGLEAIELNKYAKWCQYNLIDIAPNCLNTNIQADITNNGGMSEFFNTSLWDMEIVPTVKYGYCVDVMEHIPPDMVEYVIQRI